MKFSPQIHLTVCLALLMQLAAPGIGRADPPHTKHRPQNEDPKTSVCDRINAQEVKDDENKRNEVAENYFKGWESVLKNQWGKIHRSAENRATMAKGIQVQDAFLYQRQVSIRTICNAQLNAEKAVTAMTQSMATVNETEIDSANLAQVCGRDLQLKKLYTSSFTALGAAKKVIDDEMKKSMTEFSQMGVQNQGAVFQPSIAHSESQRPLLEKEFELIWGRNFKNGNPNAKNFRPDPKSAFGRVLGHIQMESNRNSTTLANLKQGELDMTAKVRDCVTAGYVSEDGKLVPQDSDGDGKTDTNPFVTEGNDPTISGDDNKTPEALAQEKADAEAKEKAAEADEKARIEQQRADEAAAAKAAEEAEIAAAKARKKDKNGNWVSNNKGILLLGAGAVAVGGALWYYNSQKSDDSDSSYMGPYYRAPSSTSTSSSTSTVTLTQSSLGSGIGTVPEGSIISVDNIQTDAKVNETLQPITVQISSPSGNPIGESDTDISVTCETGPCSLTGTILVNTDNGRAVFDNLKFTSPRSGVKLKFSAGGMVSGTSLNGVNVTE